MPLKFSPQYIRYHIAPLLILVIFLLGLLSAGCSSYRETEHHTPHTNPRLLGQSVPMLSSTFDIQAHRGGRGLYTENTLAAFIAAMELGVTTLELDTQVTKDRQVVISHDRQISSEKCIDTRPAVNHDPQFPYVGKFIKDLTYRQIATINCGFRKLSGFAHQKVVRNAHIPLLSQLFTIVRNCHSPVHMNIETKFEAGAPTETQPIDVFVHTVAEQIQLSQLQKQIMVQSFSWKALKVMHSILPDIPLYALINKANLQSTSANPWLDGLNPQDYHEDLIAMAKTIPGVSAISPMEGYPEEGKITDKNFIPFITSELVTKAHAAHLLVVPWTVNDEATMSYLIKVGSDGIITDYPDVLRNVAHSAGYAIPQATHCK